MLSFVLTTVGFLTTSISFQMRIKFLSVRYHILKHLLTSWNLVVTTYGRGGPYASSLSLFRRLSCGWVPHSLPLASSLSASLSRRRVDCLVPRRGICNRLWFHFDFTTVVVLVDCWWQKKRIIWKNKWEVFNLWSIICNSQKWSCAKRILFC